MSWLDRISAAANVVMAVAAILALREAKQWRVLRREQRSADGAADYFATCMRFLDRLEKRIAPLEVPEATSGLTRAHRYREAVQQRLDSLGYAEVQRSYEDAYWRCVTFVPHAAELHAEVERVVAAVADIERSCEELLANGRRVEDVMSRGATNIATLTKPIRVRALASLHPIAEGRTNDERMAIARRIIDEDRERRLVAKGLGPRRTGRVPPAGSPVPLIDGGAPALPDGASAADDEDEVEPSAEGVSANASERR